MLPTAGSAGSPNYMLVLYVVPALTGLVVLAIAGALVREGCVAGGGGTVSVSLDCVLLCS